MDTYNAYDIYNDIRTRTGGDIYLGVVGPVRTGKSTFIRKFANLMILPYVEDFHTAERIRDELPQSGTGRTIMTTEPKLCLRRPLKSGWAAILPAASVSSTVSGIW